MLTEDSCPARPDHLHTLVKFKHIICYRVMTVINQGHCLNKHIFSWQTECKHDHNEWTFSNHCFPSTSPPNQCFAAGRISHNCLYCMPRSHSLPNDWLFWESGFGLENLSAPVVGMPWDIPGCLGWYRIFGKLNRTFSGCADSGNGKLVCMNVFGPGRGTVQAHLLNINLPSWQKSVPSNYSCPWTSEQNPQRTVSVPTHPPWASLPFFQRTSPQIDSPHPHFRLTQARAKGLSG